MRRVLSTLAVLLAFGAVLAVVPMAAAEPAAQSALTIPGPGPFPGGGVTYQGEFDAGFSFTPGVDIEVTAMGFWLNAFGSPSRSLVDSHEIAIFPDLGIPPVPGTPDALARVATGSGGANTSDPYYRYGFLDPPLTLTAGSAYVILGSPRFGAEIPYPPTFDNLTINSLITVNGPRLSGPNGYGHFTVGYPNSGGTGAPIAAVNFLFEEACDSDPPTLTVSVTPNVLWPPNHKYVTVEATVTATDTVDPSPVVELVSVTSNEPDNALGDGDGNTKNDVVITDIDTFQLRAERDGNGTGRVYTITYQATDACDNTTVETATVTVPVHS